MNKVYEKITNQILNMLDKGVIPWRKTWDSIPKNISGREYHGINKLVLMCAEFGSPFWLTFKQAKNLGGYVKQGEYATFVIFWKMKEIETDVIDDQTGKPIMKKYPFLRYYSVFNVEQCDGIEVPENGHNNGKSSIDEAEKIINDMHSGPTYSQGLQPAYNPKIDTVIMPKKKTFSSIDFYYSTLFHEISHSTGHESRLNRKGISEFDYFGSHQYSKEELVAEIASAFLCGDVGLSKPTLENQAAYIKHWTEKLKDDKKLILYSAQQAQKAADFIKNV